MLLETLLQRRSPLQITNIFVRNHLTFFKVDGESFCTAAGYVHHHTDPRFDNQVIRMRAKKEHDPKEKKMSELRMKQLEYEDDLWERHQDNVLAALVLKAAEILVQQDAAAMVEFLCEHLTILPEDSAKLMAKKLEDESSSRA